MVDNLGWCQKCGKKTYRIRKHARRIARQHYSSHKSPYRCPFDERMWHVGELSWLVIRGVYVRDEMVSLDQIRRNSAA